MSLTEAEKRELEAKKDSGVKDILKQQNFDKQRKLKKELRERDRSMSAAAEAQALKENSLDWDGEPFFNKKTGDEKRPIQIGKIERSANTLISKEFSGYNDWSVAMQGLLANAVELGRALYYDPIKWTNFIPYRDTVAGGLTQIKNAAKDYTWDYTIGWAVDKLDAAALKNDELPKIRFSVAVNNGQIDTQVTKNNDPAYELNDCFNSGVVDWAQVQGYIPKRQRDGSIVFEDTSGTKLTQEKFKELNEDPATSLENFLSNRLGMSVDYNPSSSFSP